jgi:hypothetical protein
VKAVALPNSGPEVRRFGKYPSNLFTIGRTLSVDIMIGFGQMVALAAGGINLWIGSIGVCAAMCGGYLMQTLGLPVPEAIAGALSLGGLNGFVISRSDVKLISPMIGREQRAPQRENGPPIQTRIVLETRDLSTSFGHRDINLVLLRGEILDLYGLVGARRVRDPRKTATHSQHA